MNAGTCTSTTVAPAATSASNATSSRSSTSGSAPSGRSVMRPTRNPSTPWSRQPTSDGCSFGMLVESSGSCPPMTSSISAASSTLVVNGPIWSRLLANATRPNLLT